MAHRLAPQAEIELDEIWYYTATESGSVEIVDRLIDRITECFFLLAKCILSGWKTKVDRLARSLVKPAKAF